MSETISCSPDSTVSQAAWQAAIRRRPGMLLIHYNSRHVMEKILTPGEVKIPLQAIIDGSVHAALDVALGDLREWHVLRAWCRSCSHHATVKPAGLIERYGKGALLSSVERALFCTSCDRGGPEEAHQRKLLAIHEFSAEFRTASPHERVRRSARISSAYLKGSRQGRVRARWPTSDTALSHWAPTPSRARARLALRTSSIPIESGKNRQAYNLGQNGHRRGRSTRTHQAV